MNRSEGARIGAETVAIAQRGSYVSATGRQVDIADAVARSVAGTELVTPSQWPSVHRRASQLADASRSHAPAIEVTDETTLAAARRLITLEGERDVLALNFASAKNPGGGFLGGSRAQEESLARSSALYASLITAQRYYEENRRSHDPLYTDHAIYSPAVPVFRDDADGRLLDEPYELAFITAPAVNVSALRQNGRPVGPRVEETMRRRVENVLALAAAKEHRVLVLGAWGCGVFGNDPRLIARLFADALAGRLGRCFTRVVFAVFDPGREQPCLGAFREAFETVRNV